MMEGIVEQANKIAGETPDIDKKQEALSPENILRNKLRFEVPAFITSLSMDYELLEESEYATVERYMKQMKHLAEISLMLLGEYERNEAERAIYAAALNVFMHSKNTESVAKVESKLADKHISSNGR
jgi:hypothetical protein